MKSDNESPGFQADDPTTYYDDDAHIATAKNPTTSNAFFGQATYPFTDRFRVTGGIRFANDSVSKDYRIGFSTIAGEILIDSGWQHYEEDVNSTTYKAGIEFDLVKDSMLYAQIATGFKQGGLNETAPPMPFDPEELVAYELGLKNRFLGGHIQLNFEGFYYQYDNMQAQMQTAIQIGDTGYFQQSQVILNAEGGTLAGIDVEMDYLVTQNDRVSVSASFLKSKIGKFFLPPNPFGNTTDFDMTGRQMSSSPKWAGTLAYEHIWILDDGATVTATLDSKISAGYYRTLEQWQEYAWNDSYHRSNFNLTYRSSNNKWSAGVWIKNIENGAQYTWSVPFWRGQIKPPRTFGMNVSIRY